MTRRAVQVEYSADRRPDPLVHACRRPASTAVDRRTQLGMWAGLRPHFIWDYELELVARDGRVEDVEYTETKIR